MKTFEVASLTPFIPKSNKVFQGIFKTGSSQEDTFMKGLDFSIEDIESEIFIQTIALNGKNDIFTTLYSLDGG
jgi:hypothetical protein